MFPSDSIVDKVFGLVSDFCPIYILFVNIFVRGEKKAKRAGLIILRKALPT